VWAQLGNALKEQGDYTGAEGAYHRSLRLDGTAAYTHLQLGRLLRQLSGWTEAAEAYARALQLAPGLQDVTPELKAIAPRLVDEGDKARDTRDWRMAARNYRLALDCQPDLVPIWVQLGHALKEQNDYGGAEAAYHRALALDEWVADTHLQLGHLLKLQGRHNEAVVAYARAVRLDPDLTPAREVVDALGGHQALEGELGIADDGGLRGARADLLFAEAKRTSGSGDDVIWLGGIDWHWRIQRPQHLAANLADLGARIFYVSLVFEPPGGKSRFRIVESPYHGVFEIRLRLAGNHSENLYRGFGKGAIGDLQLALDELIAALGLRAPVVVVEHPAWQPVACGVPGATVVYDCLDLATGFSTNGEATARYEAAMLGTADLVVAASQPLVDHIAACRSSALIRNAADVEFFAQGFSDRPAGPRPVIGYFGAIADWFDIEWIEHCAAAQPGWDFRLVGRTDGCNVAQAKALPNVHFLGEQPYRDLPQFLREVDVAIIPFRMIELIKCTNPVKLYEYMAAGKAVVAAPMPEVIGATDLAYIAEDARSFGDRIAQALAEDSSELRSRRMEWAREHTWRSRGRQLKQAIDTTRPLVSVIILTHNNWAYTSACLDSVLDLTDYPNLEIIIVDNASTDETRDNLRTFERRDERVTVVLNDTNVGFAAGNNTGLRLAHGEFVVLLNNDTVVTRGWVRDLIRPLQLDATAGMAGPLTNAIGNEQKVKPGYGGVGDMHGWSRRFVRERLRHTLEVGNLAFFCVAIRRAVLDEVGLLDEAYGIGFFEDDDYCRRVRQARYKLLVADDVFVHHHLSASFAPRGSEANEALVARNKKLFEERWGPWRPHRYRDAPGFG
jgi:GT2 family glycosyltransferase/glycosyltransferase involved in cell wall biosynthesis